MQRWRRFVAGKEIAGKKYVVKLTIEERERLDALIRAGKSSAQLLTRARILLKADVSEGGEGWSDSAISAALDTSINNVSRTRQQLVEEGFEATLKRKYNPNSARPRIFDGAAEAKLIALTCSPAPEGFARWSLRLLEEKVVELGIVDKASDNTIGRTLKKNVLKPHRNRQWVIPPDANAGFVAAMEDVLETYQKPRDPARPLVCLDETSKQLIVETRAPIPARPGRAVRHDYEYERNGEYIHDFRAAGGLAPRQGHRPTRRRRLRTGAQGTVRRAFSRRRTNQAGPRQSQHAHSGLALRGLPRPRSAPPRKTVRMALHAQTWKLARHGRIRTRRSVEPMSQPPHSRQADPRKRSRRLAGPSKQASRKGQLAIHHRRRPRKAQEALPLNLNDSGDSFVVPVDRRVSARSRHRPKPQQNVAMGGHRTYLPPNCVRGT